MDLQQLLETFHEVIMDRWIGALVADRTSRYSREGEAVLRPLMKQSTRSFRLALCRDDWAEQNAFINMIARKRLEQGFKLSEVQGVFQLYAQTLIPLLVEHLDPTELIPTLVNLSRCVARTVAQFSEYFQNLHEEFIRGQATLLEIEVAKRTRELAESERKYKNLVEDIRDGYFVLVDGAVVFANSAFCEMHGYSLEEVLGRSYLDFVAEESRAEMSLAYERSCIESGAHPRVEYLRLHRDGRRLATEIMAKRSVYEGSAANLGVCRDFSAHAELERRKREAEKLNAVAQVAASLAHDIRNPLTAVKMNVQLVVEANGEDSRSKLLLESSLQEVESIERSVTEMMDLARPYRLNRQPVSIAPLLSGCLQVIGPRMRANGVNARVRVCRGLSSLLVDRHWMEQALLNVLFNAVNALPEGGKIVVSARPAPALDRPWAEIRVSDDGPGIPRELLPYVFDSQKGRGSGLGLANVKRIVEAHGGMVLVKQRRPHGVSVLLHLPIEA